MTAKGQSLTPYKYVRILSSLSVLFLTGALFLTGCIPPTSISESPPFSTAIVENSGQSGLVATIAPTLLPSPTPGVDSIEGSLKNQVYNLEERMPGAHSEGFVVPNDAEQAAFAELVSRIETRDLLQAAKLAWGNHYELIQYTDRDDEQATSYILREMTPITKGWGLYALREHPANNIIVEAPHPLADERSDLIALDIYRALDARALLIAGAHRYANKDGSSDVAHVSDSIFQSIHEALLQETPGVSGVPVVLQIHGFAAENHLGYPSVVLGYGRTASQAEIPLYKEIVDALAARGINAGICDKDTWLDLCGTRNVQGSVTEGLIFIHIELDEMMRHRDSPLIAVLTQVFAK